MIWEAYQSVKAKGGTAGINEEFIQDFERNLKDNLFRPNSTNSRENDSRTDSGANI